MTLQQKYRDRYSILLTLGFLGLTLSKAIQVLLDKGIANFELWSLVFIAFALAITSYLLINSTLKVKIGKKKISVRLQPFSFIKLQLRKENIDNIHFVTTTPLASYGGALVHFGGHHHLFNFGGNKAMIITLKNGRHYSFISRELFNQKEEILNKVF